MQILKNAAICAVGGAVAFSLATAHTSYAQEVILSVANNTGNQLGGLTFTDNEAVSYDFASDTATSGFSIDSGDLDAFHLLPNGNFLASALFNLSYNGTSYSDGQMVEINPTALTSTLFWDAETTYTSGNADISAFTLAPNGDYLFSDIGSGSIGTTSFTSGDLVRYNPTSGVATIEIAAATLFDDGAGNIYGAHLLDDGRFVLTANADEVVSGITFTDASLFIYDPSDDSAELFLDSSVFGNDVFDIDAVYVVAIPEPATLGLLALGGTVLIRRRRVA